MRALAGRGGLLRSRQATNGRRCGKRSADGGSGRPKTYEVVKEQGVRAAVRWDGRSLAFFSFQYRLVSRGFQVDIPEKESGPFSSDQRKAQRSLDRPGKPDPTAVGHPYALNR